MMRYRTRYPLGPNMGCWGPAQENKEHLPSPTMLTLHLQPAPPPADPPSAQRPPFPSPAHGTPKMLLLWSQAAVQLLQGGSGEGWSTGCCQLNAGASLPRVHERLPVQTALDALRRLIPNRSRSEAQLQPLAAGAEDAPGLCLSSPAPGNRDKTIRLRGSQRKITLTVSGGVHAFPGRAEH